MNKKKLAETKAVLSRLNQQQYPAPDPIEIAALKGEIAEEEQSEQRRLEDAERRLAEQQMEQPPDWLRAARSPYRLKVANAGLEPFARYQERLARVRSLSDFEAQYRGALARKDQARADFCLLRIARLQEQLRQAFDPEPVLTGYGKYH